MSHNIKELLDKLKSKGFPIYKIEKELKIGSGYLNKISSGYRIMTKNILDKLLPFYKEKIGEDFNFIEKEDFVGTIQLPEDYLDFKQIGILGQDGTIKTIAFKREEDGKITWTEDIKGQWKFWEPAFRCLNQLGVDIHATDKETKPSVIIKKGVDVEDIPFEEHNKEIRRQIKLVESEKVPDHRNTSIGRKSWASEQRNKISELYKLLKK